MPTKATLKLIRQLQQKKYRKQEGLFVVEGLKSVEEFLKSEFVLKGLFSTKEKAFPNAEIITSSEMDQISSFSTPPGLLAVFEQKKTVIPSNLKGHYFALDGIQDPGNLGTIIRIADWFGMKHIFCSNDTADVYNPKVIQACMGSLTRVEVHYTQLNLLLKNVEIPVYGTFMSGDNIYTSDLSSDGIILLGNEANGISSENERHCTRKISIPQNGNSTESLNVAMAAAIIGSEFFRRKY